jgi:transposase
MANGRISMRSIKELLRLKFDNGLSNRAIAKSCGLSHTVVNHYILRARQEGIGWPLQEDMDDTTLEGMLSCREQNRAGADPHGMPPLQYMYNELKRKGVTLQLLWYEYKQANPGGYQYSWFCEQYRSWLKTLEVTLRQEHRAGEKLFVDWAGQTVAIQNPATGEQAPAQIFIACLGASSYTYAEARISQTLPDWIGAHVKAFAFFGGVPEILVPDNLKTGVSSACRYEPALNPTYQDLAAHYGIAVIPARPNHPRDKAKVEAAVGFAERFILAALRNRTFFSLAELNQAIAEKLEELNSRKFQKLDTSRRELFEQLDKPALKPLPEHPYEYAQWKKATVNIDYHIEIERHYYSVPYQLVRKQVDVRITAQTVEVLFKNRRVASHTRSSKKGGYSTVTEHMPERHKKYLEWTPARLIRWAGETGPNTQRLVTAILSSKVHPQQGYRSCLGIMRLAKRYGTTRLEAACCRALLIQSYSYRSIESILNNHLDQQELVTLPPRATPQPVTHENIRGRHYYQPQDQAEGEILCLMNKPLKNSTA